MQIDKDCTIYTVIINTVYIVIINTIYTVTNKYFSIHKKYIMFLKNNKTSKIDFILNSTKS